VTWVDVPETAAKPTDSGWTDVPAKPPAPSPVQAAAAQQPALRPKPPPKPNASPTTQQVHGDNGLPGMAHAIHAFFNNAMVGGFRSLQETVAHPIEGANNIEQTLARGSSTIINAALDHHLTAGTLAKAFQNMFDVGGGAPEVERVNRAIVEHMPAIRHDNRNMGNRGTSQVPEALGTFTEHLVASFLSDPVTFVPIVGQVAKIATVAKALKGVADGARAVAGMRLAQPVVKMAKAAQTDHADAIGSVAKSFKKMFGGRPELDEYLAPHAKAAHLGFEHANITRIQKELGVPDEELLAANRDALRNVKPTEGKGYDLPPAIRQRYLQEPWRYGTPEMRAQAEALGYKPVAADTPWKAKPEGVLDYNLRDDYQFLGKVSDMSTSPAFRKYGGKTFGEAGFEKERTENWTGLKADQFDRVAARLRMGRDAIRRRRAQIATQEYIGKFGGWKPSSPVNPDAISQRAAPALKDIVKHLSTDPVRLDGFGRKLSTLAGQAVQGSVFPHAINNVGTLSFLKSPIGTGRAIGHMLNDLRSGGKGISEADIKRIEEMGAAVDYHSNKPTTRWGEILTGGKLGGKALEASQALLNRMELAYRKGLLEELDRTLGPSTPGSRLEMEKGQQIRDAVVDYRNIPLVIAAMEYVGAPFAPFLSGLTSAVSIALRTHPERVAAVQKIENGMQQDLGVTVPNPVNTFENWLDPLGNFIRRSGPAGQFLDRLHEHKPIPNLNEVLGDQVQRYGGPWASQVPGFFNLPIPERGVEPGTFSPEEGLQHFLTGTYPYNPASQFPIRQIERSAGRQEE